jgi:NADH-quinone oxidoreductase subunit D
MKPGGDNILLDTAEHDYRRSGFHFSHDIQPQDAAAVAEAFRQEGFVLEHLCCLDLRDTDVGAFRVVYQFNNRESAERHLCRTNLVNGSRAVSIASIFGNAEWLEREAWDMHGVEFDGHPDLRRLLLPMYADFHPLRKDFDARDHNLTPPATPYQPVTVDLGDDRETFYLNMGPQHPSMHGVLRICLELDGERIVGADTIIGYAHRAHEKMAENRDYTQFLPNTSRIDYLSAMIYNIAYCEALEKMLGIEPPERALHIRAVVSELNRIQSHLLWIGTFLLDLGAVTPFLYVFDDREKILEILDRVSGSRLTYAYGTFGGVVNDLDDQFLEDAAAFAERLRSRGTDYRRLVTDNVIFRRRTEGIGPMDEVLARGHAVSGPCIRGAGIPYDVRRSEPYGIYDQLEFEIPVREEGDCFGRFAVRVLEMEQSLRIVEQAISTMPEGPIVPDKVPRVIKPPEGEYYYAVESARGHFGMFIVSDGSPTPVRHKLVTPSFFSLSTMKYVLPGTMIADTIAIVGSIDIVLPEVDR